MGAIWGSFGSHLGFVREPFGGHVGSFADHLGIFGCHFVVIRGSSGGHPVKVVITNYE